MTHIVKVCIESINVSLLGLFNIKAIQRVRCGNEGYLPTKIYYSALCIIRTQKIRENRVELYQNRIKERANWPGHSVVYSQ